MRLRNPFRSPPLRHLLAASAMGAIVAATSLPANGALAATATPRLEVIRRTHAFGTVREGEVVEHSFTLVNRGESELHVHEVVPACSCTTVLRWPRSLGPGQTGLVTARLDTRQLAGPLTKAIAVRSDDPSTPELTLELRLTVFTPVTLTPRTILFPAIADPTMAATRTAIVRSELAAPLAFSGVESDNPRFKARLSTVSPGKEFSVEVAVVPPLPEGAHQASVTLRSANPEAGNIILPVVATVLPAVQVSPDEFRFTERRLAAAERRFLVLLNHRGPALAVSDVDTNVPGATWTIATGQKERQVTITVTFPVGFEPAPDGQFWLRGRTHHPALPEFKIPIVIGKNP